MTNALINGTREKIVQELVEHHDLDSKQISFEGDSTEPIFDYEALNYLRLRLTDLQASKPFVAERNEESGFVTVMFEITLADGRKVNEIGTSQVGETMHSGNKVDHILKAQNVATARAMRRAIRAAGINLFKAHKRFMETGEVAEGNTSVELEKELKNARGREIHALKDEWGHNEEDYRKFIKNLFGSEKTSSLHLSDIEKSQLVTTYKGMISARNKANSDTAKIAA